MDTTKRMNKLFDEIREIESDIQDIMDSVHEVEFDIKVDAMITRTLDRYNYRPVGWHLTQAPKQKGK